MEYQETVTPAPTLEKPLEKNNEELERHYEFSLNNDSYLVTMKVLSEERIFFQIRQINNISFYFYEKEFNYENIVKIFLLQKNYYDNINKIFQFFDKAVNKSKVSLSQNKEKKTLVLTLQKSLDFDEVECSFDLIEKKLTNEEMLKILFNEIREMKHSINKTNNGNINNNNNDNNNKNNEKNENNHLIKKLVKQNEELEKKMNKIIDENIKLKNSISELENRINNVKEKDEIEEKENIIEEETKFKSQNIDVNFYGNPENLQFKEILVANNTKSGWLRQFVVYTGLLDNIEYLIYGDKKSNINIYTIKDKQFIDQFKGHKSPISVMRYFIQNNTYEYLLSCDESKIVICWDLQNYKQYLKIITNYSGYIWDTIILFNIFDKNYIFIPSYDLNENTKIYAFKENSNSPIKGIFGTKENKTNYLIPWFYKNNYYLIECCNSKISINNIFKDENYVDLTKEPEGSHCCGYIYNDNYLCVTDYNNSFVRIWDLVRKTMYKEIELGLNLVYEIIPWNNIYSVIACGGYLVVIDLKQEKIICKIKCKKSNTNFCGIKKIQISDLGECLLCSDSKSNISLYYLNNI